VELTPGMDVVPDVARSWEVLEGGHKYLFYLRDDVYWSDGQPLTARDFEYAWKRVLDPAIQSDNAELLFDIKNAYSYHQRDITDPNEIGVCALDDTTLQVELEGQTGYFLYLLSHSPLFPVPRHVVSDHGAAWTQLRYIVTNGPFLLDDWRPGEFMSLRRNPSYHGSFRGSLQRVELSYTEYGQVHIEKYAEQDFDILDLWGFLPKEMEHAQGRFTGEYISAPRPGTGYAGFNVRQAPLDDQRVRQALALSLDKEHLAHVVLRGYYFPATGGFVPPGLPGHSEGLSLLYDPQKARALLAEAGYPGGSDFPVLRGLSFAGAEAWTDYIQSQWREKLGIQVTWQIDEWSQFLNNLAGGNYQVLAIAWQSDYPDPDSFLRASNISSLSNWQDEAYDQLVEQARRMADQEQRLELYRQADRMLVEQASIIPLTYMRYHLLVKPWVKNLSIDSGKFWSWKNVILEPH
jgi:oligopeptide transport system substrate-binding protein